MTMSEAILADNELQIIDWELIAACSCPDAQAEHIEEIIQRGGNTNAVVPGSLRAPMHFVVLSAINNSQRDIKSILWLLHDYQTDTEAQTALGETPFILYAKTNPGFALIDTFHEIGADLDAQDINGTSGLMFYAAKGNEEAARRMVDHKVRLDLKNNRHQTAEDIARHKQHHRLADFLKKSALAQQSHITLYARTDVKAQMEDANERRRVQLEKLIKSGNRRELSGVAREALPALEGLVERFPHFEEVIEHIADQCALSLMNRGQAFRLNPLLLVGGPGIGKTRFIKEVAAVLGVEYSYIGCNTVTAGFVLSGGHSMWRDSRPGQVANILRDGKSANPLILIDEVDKLSSDTQHDGFGPLYSLLERDTAKVFTDEHLEIPMDASYIAWVATANNLHVIPEPILKRFELFTVATPSREQMRLIVPSVYQDILTENARDWGSRFAGKLNTSVIDFLADDIPRDIQKTLQRAMGRAARRRNCDIFELSVDDFGARRQAQMQRIGF